MRAKRRDPTEEVVVTTREKLRYSTRIAMRTRRLMKAKYGENCDKTMSRDEYKAAYEKIKAEVVKEDHTIDLRTVRSPHDPERAKRQQDLAAEPQGHKVRKQMMSSVKEALMQTFTNLGGVEGYTVWAKRNPDKFYEHYMKLLPIELKATVDINTDISKMLEEGRMRIAQLKEVEGERVDDIADRRGLSVGNHSVIDAGRLDEAVVAEVVRG